MREGPVYEQVSRFADRLAALGGEVLDRSSERCRVRWEVDGVGVTAEAAAQSRGSHRAVYTLSTRLRRSVSTTPDAGGYRAASPRPIDVLPTVVFSANKSLARVLTRIGVGRATGAGDAAFDRDVFVDTELAGAEIRHLLAAAEVRAALREVLRLGVGEISLNGRDGELGLRWWHDVDRIDLAAVGKALAAIEKHLPPVSRLGKKTVRAETATAGAVTIVGPVVLLLATQVASCGTQRLDESLRPDLGWGGLAALLVVAIGWLVSRHRAQARPHFLATAFIGAPCMGVAVAELVFTLNVMLDQPVEMPAVARRAYTSDNEHYLEIVEAPLTSRPITIEVLRSIRDTIGDRRDVEVTLKVGPGRWGRPWIRTSATKVLPVE